MTFKYQPNLKLHVINIVISMITFILLFLHPETHTEAVDAITLRKISSYNIVFFALAFSIYYSLISMICIRRIKITHGTIILPQIEIVYRCYNVKISEVNSLKFISRDRFVLGTNKKNYLLKKSYFHSNEFEQFVELISPQERVG